MVQKSTPGLDFGSASVWLLARKRNDDLAVQYEDCPCLATYFAIFLLSRFCLDFDDFLFYKLLHKLSMICKKRWDSLI